MGIPTSLDFECYTASLPSDVVAWNELSPAADSIRRSPAFILGTMPAQLSLPMLSEFTTGPVRLYTLKNGALTADCIIGHDGRVFHSMIFNHPDYHVEQVMHATRADRPDLPVRHIPGEAVMLAGPGYIVYGHWLVDFLPRLWVLRQAGYEPSNLKYLVPAQIPPFVVPLLQTFGIHPDQLVRYDEQSEVIEADTLLLPTNLRRASRLDPSMRLARDYLLDRVRACAPIPQPPPGHERIFVSRQTADPSRSLANRARIEQIATDHGYVVVQPEKLSFLEQIGLFSQVRAVVGEYGSGLHNSMFAPPGTVVCALRSTSIHPGFIQSSLDQVFGNSTGYVLADSPLDAVHQSFEVSEQFFCIALKAVDLLCRDAARA